MHFYFGVRMLLSCCSFLALFLLLLCLSLFDWVDERRNILFVVSWPSIVNSWKLICSLKLSLDHWAWLESKGEWFLIFRTANWQVTGYKVRERTPIYPQGWVIKIWNEIKKVRVSINEQFKQLGYEVSVDGDACAYWLPGFKKWIVISLQITF